MPSPTIRRGNLHTDAADDRHRRLARPVRVRAPALKDSGLSSPLSREGGLLLNNLFLSVAAGVVFFGTLFPLFASAFDYTVSVGAFLQPGVRRSHDAFLMSCCRWGRCWPGSAPTCWAPRNASGSRAWPPRWSLSCCSMRSMAAPCWRYSDSVWRPGSSSARSRTLPSGSKLFRAPPATSWSRLRNVPRSTLGMTLAHGGPRHRRRRDRGRVRLARRTDPGHAAGPIDRYQRLQHRVSERRPGRWSQLQRRARRVRRQPRRPRACASPPGTALLSRSSDSRRPSRRSVRRASAISTSCSAKIRAMARARCASITIRWRRGCGSAPSSW